MEFHDLFRGRDDVYGKYIIGERKEGKVQGKAWTKKEKLTKQIYQDHLDGKEGLGIVPIMKDGTCYWGTIDIDNYDLDLFHLETKILKMPLVLCRTKSGGGHLYLFLKDPAPAPILRQKLSDLASFLGYSSSEIFPKQSEIKGSAIGNWINLPYFNQKKTVRYCIRNGKALELDEFLKYSKYKSITSEDLAGMVVAIPEDFSDGPPCLQHLIKIKIEEGQRDLILFNLAVYCKLKYSKDWINPLQELNQKYVKPSLKESELTAQIIKPHRKKTYFYMCNKIPLNEHCDKITCRDRQFGISGETPSVVIGELIKITTVPPTWYLQIENKQVELTTLDLLDQTRFRKICFEAVHKIPKRIKETIWDRMMQGKLDKLEVIKAPKDAGPIGQFYYLLRVFCTERAIARNRGELLQQKPWSENGRIYFQSRSLLTFLESQKFKAPPAKIYAWVRELGGSPTSFSVKGKPVRLWSVPEYKDQQTEDFDLPPIEEAEF